VLVVKWIEDTPVYAVNNWIHIYAKNVDDRVDLLNAMVWSSVSYSTVDPFSSTYTNYPGIVATTGKVNAVSTYLTSYTDGEPVNTLLVDPFDFLWEEDTLVRKVGDSFQSSVEPVFTQMSDIADATTDSFEAWDYYGSNHVDWARIDESGGTWGYYYTGTIYVAITDFGGNTNRTASFRYSDQPDIIVNHNWQEVDLDYGTQSYTFTNVSLDVQSPSDYFLRVERDSSTGLGIEVVYDFGYAGAAARAIRVSYPLAHIGISTNISKTVDAYMLGKYPIKDTRFDPVNLSYEPWLSSTGTYFESWYTVGLGGYYGNVSLNQLFPIYGATNEPPFTWTVPVDIPILANLTPTYYVYIETQDLGYTNYYVFDDAMTTNSIANSNPTDADVSSGWAIRNGLNVLKWDFEYK
jgi:hypothetical protein